MNFKNDVQLNFGKYLVEVLPIYTTTFSRNEVMGSSPIIRKGVYLHRSRKWCSISYYNTYASNG